MSSVIFSVTLVVATSIVEISQILLEVLPMSEAKIAQKSPIAVDVEAGKSYYWCSCGHSAAQPFCDGAHKGTGFTPVKYEATESKKVHFCACKHSANPITCDGSHSKL